MKILLDMTDFHLDAPLCIPKWSNQDLISPSHPYQFDALRAAGAQTEAVIGSGNVQRQGADGATALEKAFLSFKIASHAREILRCSIPLSVLFAIFTADK